MFLLFDNLYALYSINTSTPSFTAIYFLAREVPLFFSNSNNNSQLVDPLSLNFEIYCIEWCCVMMHFDGQLV